MGSDTKDLHLQGLRAHYESCVRLLVSKLFTVWRNALRDQTEVYSTFDYTAQVKTQTFDPLVRCQDRKKF